MTTQRPDVPGLGEGGILQFLLHIEVVLLDVLVVELGKKLVDLRGLEAGEVEIELRIL